MSSLPSQPSRPSSSPGGLSVTPSPSRSGGKTDREQFAADELAITLSHFQIDMIDAIRSYPRGSRRSPKLILRSGGKLYLLKRRARGKDDPDKVAFCHSLQLHLADKKFPLPRLIGTKQDNNSMFVWKDRIYELFEYIKGSSYDSSLQSTEDSGRTLALFHKLLCSFEPEFEPAKGAYHAAKNILLSIQSIPAALAKVDPRNADQRADTVKKSMDYLLASYKDAAGRVNQLGLPTWPAQIVHGDWHPGNILFRGQRIVAVIDYDAARIQQRILDIANGALQFSIIGGGDDASKWPDHFDEARLTAFIKGYESVPDSLLARSELRSVPWLMIEALIAESAIPIAATGTFARMDGFAFMQMVARKIRWLQKNHSRMVRGLE